ncbi:threonine-phosphate decarboxylase CobD [Nitrosomonas marina]|uniref:threonine-phosphate decarboxylase n=1 Tax=Nitrosomonas marina TaxID=917 RepID=A0A1H8INP2_9PROT|nr:threonine-phosphate decarboxylase CobD [Nitrosomonas marina]SEN70333.1 L-threonine O-3-phosphate decarboxylase [Nitrosomonas marina]
MNTQHPFDRKHGSGILHHGGRLREAAICFDIPMKQWLDLSTGINPNSWPVKIPPASTWSRLPEDIDELNAVACRYYGADALLPTAGSQAAIQILPQLRPSSRVGVLTPGYAEHAAMWRRFGHTVTPLAPEQISSVLPETDVLVLIHPNNPTGATFQTSQLMAWHKRLIESGGWLIVDEAYMDATPESSIVSYATKPGLIVLRSLGKFFGLAGARVGFVCAHSELLTALNHRLGPWAVSTPARWMAIQALLDSDWQHTARQFLQQAGRRLYLLLSQHGLRPDGGCAFFQWIRCENASELFEKLAYQGILVRLFDDPPSLRFGLPCTDSDWQRLDASLSNVLRTV